MRSLLLSNLRNLGDVICSTAALNLIRDNMPQTRIGLLVKADAEEVVRGHPAVDDLYVFPRRRASTLATVWRMATQIRPKGYEYYLSLDRKPRSALVAWLAGIRPRVTPSHLLGTANTEWWMRLLFQKILPYETGCFHSLVEMFLDPTRQALGLMGRRPTSLPPLLPEHRARAAELLTPAFGRPKVGFSVKANFPLKTWPAERFARVMDRLEEDAGAFIYVTGAPGDREYIDQLLALRQHQGGLNLAGKTDVLETAALAAASDLFITLDTGAVHVAGNSGLAHLVCIFTCTEPVGVLDSAPMARVIYSGEACSPCQRSAEECPEPLCQRRIGVEQVYEAAMAVLRNKK